MKKSLEKSETNNTEVDAEALAEIAGDTAVATAPGQSLMNIGQVSGDVDSRDLVIPRLELVQKVGPLSTVESLDFGDLVLNKSITLSGIHTEKGPNTEVLITVLSIVKSYEEVVPYDPSGQGPRGRTFTSAAQLDAADLWTDWRNDQKPPAREVANMLVLIEQPEGLDSPSFHLGAGGKRYALAAWVVRSGAYNRAAKKVFSADKIELAETGLVSGVWSLHTERYTSGGNVIAVPFMQLVGKHDMEVLKPLLNKLQSKG